MGVVSSMGIGFAGGAIAGGAAFGALADVKFPELGAVAGIAGAAGAGTGLVAGIASRSGAGGVKAALIGAGVSALVPAGFIAAAKLSNDDSGWASLGYIIMGAVTGAGVAGASAALVGRALLR